MPKRDGAFDAILSRFRCGPLSKRLQRLIFVARRVRFGRRVWAQSLKGLAGRDELSKKNYLALIAWRMKLSEEVRG
jgi:hypothetical protein